MKSNFEAIQCYLQTLHTTFDAIAISETWLDEETKVNYNITGYDALHTVRGLRKGGGVAIYVKKQYNGRLLAHQSMALDNVFECISAEVRTTANKRLILNCTYRTPASDIKLFCDCIEQVFNRVHSKTMFVCGDFNIDLLKCENH